MVLVIVAVMVLSNIQSSTIGQCTEAYDTETNNTALTGNGSHILVLSSILTGYDANLTVTHDGSTGNVSYNGNYIGELNATSPRTFSVAAAYLASATNITYYDIIGGTTNVTETNITYYRLSNCNYPTASYNAMNNVSNKTFNALSISAVLFILGIAAVIMFYFKK